MGGYIASEVVRNAETGSGELSNIKRKNKRSERSIRVGKR